MQTSSAFKLWLLLAACISAQVNRDCFYYFPYDFVAFNLKSLIEIGVQTVPFTLSVDNTPIQGSITYNLCGEIAVPPKCPDSGKMSHAFFMADDKSICYNLISATTIQNTYQFLDESSIDSMTQGFSIKKLTENFILAFKCNLDAKTPQFKPGYNSYTIETKDACGYVNEAARVFTQLKIIFSVTLMVFGIILTFFGGYKWRYFSGVIGFGIGVAATFYVFWAIVASKPEIWTYCLISLLAIMVGALFAFTFRKFPKFSYLIFGLVAGLSLVKNAFYILQFRGSDVS
jgi:hypothetical protein